MVIVNRSQRKRTMHHLIFLTGEAIGFALGIGLPAVCCWMAWVAAQED